MLFKTIKKQAFFDFYFPDFQCVGPKKVGINNNGKPIYQFLPFSSFDEIDLDYETTEYSAKTYFLPYKETLSSFEFKEDDWTQNIKYSTRPRVIIGLHPCDINGLIKLDKVFEKTLFPDPYYITRRQNTFVVGIDCKKPCDGGFCSSVGSNTVTHGFDLFLTDIGDRYFVKIGSDRAFNALQKIKTSEITKNDNELYLQTRNKFEDGFEKTVRVENLPNLLDIEFESDVWGKWGDKCLSCGTCAMVCPTCYCYGITEHISMDFNKSDKIKQLYSCNLNDFAQVAGGHNFRPEPATRLKYRYYHQHRGFVESFGQPLCVGCNRCGRACLSGINPTDVISDLQREQKR
ncbi:4Fe-4S dicluster domain-containing protein [Desulfobacula sp.]|uniref:4Fe-4S dicluster domain-containing protein n=1 Tax=Desulfobacula sp. TaxID=2593537 RepID=UPI0025C62741|nr:4Fe-4S dicluster domain-containing protein [Desulfobacula sp.]MBC2703227.1 4Fe-4S dicluster domain-containing protein [Desulfobacula sp.]